MFKSITFYILLFLLLTIGVLSLQIKFKDNKIEELRDKVAQGKASVFLMQSANDVLVDTMNSQSAAVSQLKKQGDQLMQNLISQKEIVENLEAKTSARILSIDSEIVPHDCVGAMGWMLNKAGE